jgi:hypothetical protein
MRAAVRQSRPMRGPVRRPDGTAERTPSPACGRAGEGALLGIGLNCQDSARFIPKNAPSPTLPRKREREQSAVGAQSPYCATSPRRNKGIAPPLRHLRAKPLPRHNKGIAPYLPLAIGKSDEREQAGDGIGLIPCATNSIMQLAGGCRRVSIGLASRTFGFPLGADMSQAVTAPLHERPGGALIDRRVG